MDVIKSLNKSGTNSIKFTSNSKIISEFDFSFELCWPLVKVFNINVVPNISLHLKIKIHIFLRWLCIFPDFLSTSALNRNSFHKNKKSFLSNGLDPPTRFDPVSQTRTRSHSDLPVSDRAAFSLIPRSPCCPGACPIGCGRGNPGRTIPTRAALATPIGRAFYRCPSMAFQAVLASRVCPHAATPASPGRAVLSRWLSPRSRASFRSDKARLDKAAPIGTTPHLTPPRLTHSRTPCLPSARYKPVTAVLRATPMRLPDCQSVALVCDYKAGHVPLVHAHRHRLLVTVSRCTLFPYSCYHGHHGQGPSPPVLLHA
jgi:hypothetical protein